MKALFSAFPGLGVPSLVKGPTLPTGGVAFREAIGGVSFLREEDFFEIAFSCHFDD